MIPWRQLAMRIRFSCASPLHQREHAVHRAHGVARVQRRQHEVPRLGRLERDLHRLLVADLADEDDVGILPERGAQRGARSSRCRSPTSRWLRCSTSRPCAGTRWDPRR